jgi:hypothetical protein
MFRQLQWDKTSPDSSAWRAADNRERETEHRGRTHPRLGGCCLEEGTSAAGSDPLTDESRCELCPRSKTAIRPVLAIFEGDETLNVDNSIRQ